MGKSYFDLLSQGKAYSSTTTLFIFDDEARIDLPMHYGDLELVEVDIKKTQSHALPDRAMGLINSIDLVHKEFQRRCMEAGEDQATALRLTEIFWNYKAASIER